MFLESKVTAKLNGLKESPIIFLCLKNSGAVEVLSWAALLISARHSPRQWAPGDWLSRLAWVGWLGSALHAYPFLGPEDEPGQSSLTAMAAAQSETPPVLALGLLTTQGSKQVMWPSLEWGHWAGHPTFNGTTLKNCRWEDIDKGKGEELEPDDAIYYTLWPSEAYSKDARLVQCLKYQL